MDIQLYDTTLRDGAQREGISFSVEDKIRIARKLDELGIHFIEGGLLVFDGRFSPLQAEAAVIQALPLIESLVAKLPPIDPTPGGKVVALRLSRA